MRHRRPAAARSSSCAILCLALGSWGFAVRGQSGSGANSRDLDGTPSPKGPGARLVENLTGSLRVKGAWYPQDPEPHPGLDDTDSVTVDGRLHFESWLNRGPTRLDLAGWLEYGSCGDARWKAGVARPRDREDRSRPIGIERLVLSRLVGDAEQWEFALGKDLFRSSVAVMGTLADRHSVAYDVNDLLDPTPRGVWQVRTQYLADDGQLTLAALPAFAPTKTPVAASRWYLGQDAGQELIPANVRIVVHDDLPDRRFPELGWLLRYARQSAGLDWFVLGYRGFSNYVTYELVDIRLAPGVVAVLAETYTPCWEGGAGVSTSRGPWELHGEAHYYRPDGRRTDELLNYVVGTTVRLGRLAETVHAEDVSLTVEYMGEAKGQEAERQATVFDPELFRIRSAAFAQLSVLVNADLALTVRTLHELDQESAHYGRIEIRRRMRDNLHLTVAGELFEAQDHRAAGWNRNDRLQLQLTYTF